MPTTKQTEKASASPDKSAPVRRYKMGGMGWNEPPDKRTLYKTARIAVASNGFKIGDFVSVEYMPHTRWGGHSWYLVNGGQIVLPDCHLANFVL